MNSADANGERPCDGGAIFATTRWSVVLAAKDGSLSQANAALEKLCRIYWPPVYAFIRRQGHGLQDAQDLTQEFFRKLLEKNYLGHLVHQQGRFRSFLLKFVQHFLADERDKARAQKRGGGQEPISFDGLSDEERARLEPAHGLTPERAFEQQWVRSVVQEAQQRLQHEYVANGNEALFERLKGIEPGERGAVTYAQIAAELNVTEGAIKGAMHRMRQRHRELLREEIAQTVSTPLDLEQEVRYFISVLGG